MKEKGMTASEFGKFGQQALQKRLGSRKAVTEHFKKIRAAREAKRKALRSPTITEGGAR